MERKSFYAHFYGQKFNHSNFENGMFDHKKVQVKSDDTFGGRRIILREFRFT